MLVTNPVATLNSHNAISTANNARCGSTRVSPSKSRNWVGMLGSDIDITNLPLN